VTGETPVAPDEKETEPTPPAGRRRRRSLLVEYGALVLVALLVALVMKAFVAQAFSIPSPSMYPELKPGDRVVVSRLAYHLHDPRRGDIIVFDSPTVTPRPREALPVRLFHDVLEAVGLRTPPETELIKRVIALPGEVVEGRNGRVYIDGQLLVEPYLQPDVRTADFPAERVPVGQLWVMGDNRGNSADSRVIGPISEDAIVGRALFRVWPPWRFAFL
jgi:signal peptidase I